MRKQSCHHKERGKLLKSVAAKKENAHDLRLKVLLVVSRHESPTWHACGCDFDLETMSVYACSKRCNAKLTSDWWT